MIRYSKQNCIYAVRRFFKTGFVCVCHFYTRGMVCNEQMASKFAYRISVSWWMFGIAGLLVLFIALATASFQAIKAAIANPVKSLRTE